MTPAPAPLPGGPAIFSRPSPSFASALVARSLADCRWPSYRLLAWRISTPLADLCALQSKALSLLACASWDRVEARPTPHLSPRFCAVFGALVGVADAHTFRRQRTLPLPMTRPPTRISFRPAFLAPPAITAPQLSATMAMRRAPYGPSVSSRVRPLASPLN